MLNAIIDVILYIIVALTLSTVGVGITDWQFYVVFIAMVLV